MLIKKTICSIGPHSGPGVMLGVMLIRMSITLSITPSITPGPKFKKILENIEILSNANQKLLICSIGPHSGPEVMLGVMLTRMSITPSITPSITNEHHSGVRAD